MKKLTIVSFFFLMILMAGCNTAQVQAILDAHESDVVPGQAVLDASGSTSSEGEIWSYHYTIFDTATGETVDDHASTRPEESIHTRSLQPGQYRARVTVSNEGGVTDTAEATFTTSGIVVCDSSSEFYCCSNTATCGAEFVCVMNGLSPVNGQMQTTAPLNSGGSSVLAVAQSVWSQCPNKSDIPEPGNNTTMWIQAWGGGGGNGSDNEFGKSGGMGSPTFIAQTITNLTEFQTTFGTLTINYYVGKAGTHNDAGGQGGAASLVLISPLKDSTPIDDVVVLSGGGGGGAEGSDDSDGFPGGPNGLTFTSQDVPAQANGGNQAADQDGTIVCRQGGQNSRRCSNDLNEICNANCGACEFITPTLDMATGASPGGTSGIGGQGGCSDNVDNCVGIIGWLNTNKTLTMNGMGGVTEEDNDGQLFNGGGGGGFGGGSTGTNPGDFFAGCGGGSLSQGGALNDNCAPNPAKGINQVLNPNGNGNGLIHIVFNTAPNTCTGVDSTSCSTTSDCVFVDCGNPDAPVCVSGQCVCNIECEEPGDCNVVSCGSGESPACVGGLCACLPN